MAQGTAGKFSCDQCGKTYNWKPEFAGKKVKCKCGFVMTAPKAPPAADDEPDLDAMYDLADEGKQAAVAAAPTIRCPSCKNELTPGSSLCAQCGFNLKTGKKGAAVPPRGAPVAAAGGGGAAAVAVPGGGLGAFSAFGPPRKRGVDEDRGEDKTLDWYVPTAIIAVGALIDILHAPRRRQHLLHQVGRDRLRRTRADGAETRRVLGGPARGCGHHQRSDS
jgi:hypothetical protein